MFIERRVNPSTGVVELWKCQWENVSGGSPRKVHLEKICDEQPPSVTESTDTSETSAICWAYGRTLGNIAVQSPALIGRFPDESGDDAQLPCDIVNAGKFRNGADRWWCRTHQSHWGTKGDQESFANLDVMVCANHTQRMCYVVSPKTINVNDYAEVGIWCSMPAALSTATNDPRKPKIHVHVRPDVGGMKTIDSDFAALSVFYSDSMGLFGSSEITRVNITPPAAFEFVRALELGNDMSCINCSYCGFPHLDLGDFARKPHRKHFCGNCGRDSTWSTKEIISTPLKPLHDEFAQNYKYEKPSREISLDKYEGCSYTVWASTSAIIWTPSRPQEFGIHVHIHDGKSRIVDETFGTVIHKGKALERQALIKAMIDRTII